MRRLSIIAATLVLPLALTAAVDLRDYRQVAPMRKMAEARSVDALRRAYASRRWPDAATDIVYAVRLHELKAPGADDRLIDAIPRNPSDFWFAYEAFAPHDDAVEQRLSAIYWQFWDLVPRAIVARKRGYARFLQLSEWATSGEMFDAVSGGNEVLWSGDRPAVLRALDTLAPAVRARVCGDEALPCAAAR